jgi:hypothetical protein
MAIAIDTAALPPDVRSAPAKDQDAYRAALGFEQALLAELLRGAELLPDESLPAAYAETIPTTLAEALTAQGGLGLARPLYESMRS